VIITRLRGEVDAILRERGFAEKLTTAGAGEPYITTPEELGERIRLDYGRYGKLIRAAGVRAD
jgi:tripartite-type tricarboxylate transporter receptor subunit TctC